jgi:hypothetical protein
MDGLSSEIEYDDLVYIPYTLETLNKTPFLVYYLENKNDTEIGFVHRENKLPHEHIYMGVLNWKNKSYLFYQIGNQDNEFLPTETGDLLKVTPYEMIYSRQVGESKIQIECTELFKAFPNLCFVKENEVPVVAYLGIGVSEINQQILLQTLNEKHGLFGKGYYFKDYEDALYDAYYKEDTDDFLIHLENKRRLTDKEIKDTSVRIEKNAFYHRTHFLGNVPRCNKDLKYFIYYYDDEVIYIKSLKPNGCKKELSLRKEDGYIMRYVLFLKKHSNTKKSGADSYAADSTYMIKNADDFICLSYHLIKKK